MEIADIEPWNELKCKKDKHSRFRLSINRDGARLEIAIICHCGEVAISAIVADWQADQEPGQRLGSGIAGRHDEQCSKCGTTRFRVLTQAEGNIVRIKIRCQKCEKLIKKMGIADYQASA